MILTTCAEFIGLRYPGRSLSRRRDSRDKQAGCSHAIGTPGQVGVGDRLDTRIPGMIWGPLSIADPTALDKSNQNSHLHGVSGVSVAFRQY